MNMYVVAGHGNYIDNNDNNKKVNAHKTTMVLTYIDILKDIHNLTTEFLSPH